MTPSTSSGLRGYPIGSKRRVEPVERRRAVVDIAQPKASLGTADANPARPQAPAEIQAGVHVAKTSSGTSQDHQPASGPSPVRRIIAETSATGAFASQLIT